MQMAVGLVKARLSKADRCVPLADCARHHDVYDVSAPHLHIAALPSIEQAGRRMPAT